VNSNNKSSCFDSTSNLQVLFAASEAQPLVKTGGLADVAGSLPAAIRMLGHDARLILPAYPQTLEHDIPITDITTINIHGFDDEIRLLEGMLDGELPLYLVDIPSLFKRDGYPYTDSDGKEWKDNARRFAVFSQVVALVAMNRAELGWRPDIVHCNDWQTGLVPPLLAAEDNRPATIFTIHNLSYQGIFDYPTFEQLQLPEELWSPDGLEFHDNLSFIKGGLTFADWITTVSPTYSREIRTPQLGYGLEGLLNHRSDHLSGIINGINYQKWDPESDPAIPQHYGRNNFQLKQTNKQHLQQEMGLTADDESMLFGNVGRTVEQKGIDLILEVMPELLSRGGIQLVMLGEGEPSLEQGMQKLAAKFPGKCAVKIGYDEELAHRIEAGCDSFLMPSRYEPCGLNQLYSLRYGTVPIVHRTGGLADTVTDVDPTTILDNSATGFVFDQPEAASLMDAIERAIEFYHRPGVWWKKLAVNGMQQDFSWDSSANRYIEIYRLAIDYPSPNPLGSY
jgi:starch synthase